MLVSDSEPLKSGPRASEGFRGMPVWNVGILKVRVLSRARSPCSVYDLNALRVRTTVRDCKPESRCTSAAPSSLPLTLAVRLPRTRPTRFTTRFIGFRCGCRGPVQLNARDAPHTTPDPHPIGTALALQSQQAPHEQPVHHHQTQQHQRHHHPVAAMVHMSMLFPQRIALLQSDPIPPIAASR